MFTPEQIKVVCDAYFEGGLAQEAICDSFGYPSQATLSRWVRHDARYAAFVQDGKREKTKPSPRATVKYPFSVRVEAVKMALEDGMTRRRSLISLGFAARRWSRSGSPSTARRAWRDS